MSSDDRLEIDALLSRTDKWYLGGGDRLVWTPRYPAWLDVPGFWDEAHYYHHQVGPVFSVALLDEKGDEMALAPGERRWRPSHLVQNYGAVHGLRVTEERSLLPNDVLTTTFEIRNESDRDRRLHVVAWTMIAHDPDGERRLSSVHRENDLIQWTLELHRPDEPTAEIGCALGLSPAAASSTVISAEDAPFQPTWSLTPFYDSFTDALHGAERTEGPGPIYLAIHTTVNVLAGTSETTSAFFGAAPSMSLAGDAVRNVAAQNDPTETSRQNWRGIFSSVPSFICSQPHIQKYYWYRWYGLHLFMRRKPEGNYQYPAVYEGPDYFRKHVTYSAQCHMLETRWMQNPSAARGSLLNFIHNQRPDGSFFGHLFDRFGHEESFYHADWGNAWDVHLIHPNESFLEEAYGGLSRYATYFRRKRDPDDTGLYDILNHYETGQEYMHRYVAVDEAADQIHWGENFRLKGVDAAVYMYETVRLLARIAGLLGREHEEATWSESAARTRDAVRENMWDAEAEMFSDIDGRTGRRTGVKAAVCFYPYMTDIVQEEHVAGLKKHLLNVDEFWTAYPAPSSSLDDAFFSASPFWKGRRMNCPWNGRSWPMANSHVAEALAQTAIRFADDELRVKAAEFIERFIRMMFFDETPERPNCFEHYNPITGKASVYRGFDDYQHSWVVDLIIKYVCGVRPHEEHVIVDPFPFYLDHFRIEDVVVQGRRLAVERSGDRFRSWLDGRPQGERSLGEPMRINLKTSED